MYVVAPKHLERLNRSFAAVSVLLDRAHVAKRFVVALLAVHTALLMYSAYVHSPTANEPGHLVAGLSNWKFRRFDVYNVNPPFVRMVAALPVISAGYVEDWSAYYGGVGARPEFAMGEDFVAANGERSSLLFMIARWACIPFSWIGGLVCYLWARDLYGRTAGVVACSLWCFEPNILAHACLITPDAHATAMGLAACYTFWRWLKTPSWSQAALTGLILGMSELTKTTLLLLYPLWPLMWLAYRWPERARMRAKDWFREASMLALRMGVSLYILNLGYGFESSLSPLGDFRFVSDLFTGNDSRDLPLLKDAASKDIEDFRSFAAEEERPSNRFANTWLDAVPSPFPQNYLAGLDALQRDFEHYGRPSYLRGKWHHRGWWYYYLYAVGIKVPLGLWLLAGVVFITGVKHYAMRIDSSSDGSSSSAASRRDQFILFCPAVIIFAVASTKSSFSEHMRYILPCFPFVFVWLAGNFRSKTWKLVDKPKPTTVPLTGRSEAGLMARRCMTLTFLVWSIASSLWAYPHSLSYFNEAIGGPRNGPKHLLGSNVDWGQDAYYLREWASRVSPHYQVTALCPPGHLGLGVYPSADDLSDPPLLIASVNFVYGQTWASDDDARKLERLQLLLRQKEIYSEGYPVTYCYKAFIKNHTAAGLRREVTK